MQPNRITLWNHLLPISAILLAAFPALAGNVAYTYDALNRLTRVLYGSRTSSLPNRRMNNAIGS
jgi:hypothetical protein